jgi:hypothetical protein
MRPFGPIGVDPVIESIFSLVVILASFIIYFKTKEIYELSEHKGLKYFRYVFLFFGITYLPRVLAGWFRPTFGSDFIFSYFHLAVSNIFRSITIYAGTAMFLYLLLTLLWKKLDKTFISNLYFVHSLAIIVTIVSYFQRLPYFFILFQIIAFFTAIFLMIIHRKRIFNKKQNPWVIAIYVMIFGHWILIQLLEFFVINFPQLGTAIYLITMCFFVILLDRVWLHFSNSTKENKNEKKRKTRTNKRYSNNHKTKK